MARVGCNPPPSTRTVAPRRRAPACRASSLHSPALCLHNGSAHDHIRREGHTVCAQTWLVFGLFFFRSKKISFCSTKQFNTVCGTTLAMPACARHLSTDLRGARRSSVVRAGPLSSAPSLRLGRRPHPPNDSRYHHPHLPINPSLNHAAPHRIAPHPIHSNQQESPPTEHPILKSFTPVFTFAYRPTGVPTATKSRFMWTPPRKIIHGGGGNSFRHGRPLLDHWAGKVRQIK